MDPRIRGKRLNKICADVSERVPSLIKAPLQVVLSTLVRVFTTSKEGLGRARFRLSAVRIREAWPLGREVKLLNKKK